MLDQHSLSRIVAVERAGPALIRIFRRDGGVVSTIDLPHQPWLIADDDTLRNVGLTYADVSYLSGSEPLAARISFDDWSQFLRARSTIREAGCNVFAAPTLAEQYLFSVGGSLFADLSFDDIIRAQIDIETRSLDPREKDARVLIICASINGEQPLVLRADEISESQMLRELTAWIQVNDPDVIEGHNIFNFDIPYLRERARRLNISLAWGRDGSDVRFGGEQRFKAGARTIPYRSAYVFGRHIVDTYQQVQRYDVTGQLESYALKPAIKALGLERQNRTHIDGRDIARTWDVCRAKLVEYAVDDVFDVCALSELTFPTEFYQCGILPRSLQSVATGGPGEKINDLLIQGYVAEGYSIPLPEPPRGYPGGYVALHNVGVHSPIVKCDVESLYPSIMLVDRIAPARDRLGVFIPTLAMLTDRRLKAKKDLVGATGRQGAQLQGIQSSLKVLINSFYGYLGYSRGYFNDFDAAERVTIRGREIIQRIVGELERLGASVIEVDTDGAFMRPPSWVVTEMDEQKLIDRAGRVAGPGIRLAHDGRFQGMLSLRLKNYALLTYDGRVLLKGSSLRSRREETFLRVFLSDAVARFLQPERYGDARTLYLDTARRVQRGELSPEHFARTETITDQTFRSESTRRLAAAVKGNRVGERVQVYRRVDGTLAIVNDYAGDEDRSYLLQRLRDSASRFRPLFDSGDDFEYTFPAITPITDIDALKRSPRSTQLSLFEI